MGPTDCVVEFTRMFKGGWLEVRENSGLLGIGARMEEYFVNKEGNHSCKRKTVLGIGPVPLPSVQTER